MRKLTDVLRDLDMEPFDREGAKVAVTVYHSKSMDEPITKVIEMSEAQLATNSNRSLAEKVREMLDYGLVDILSKWRGA